MYMTADKVEENGPELMNHLKVIRTSGVLKDFVYTNVCMICNKVCPC